MQKEIQINQEYSLKKELEEKIFARCSQLLNENGEEFGEGKKLNIGFVAYDAIEDRILSSEYFESSPFFLDDELKNKIVLMRIIEEVTSSQTTELEDLIGAIINPALCKNKEISTIENEKDEVLEVILTSV